MTGKRCLPIITSELASAKEIVNAATDYGLYELWLDYLEDWDDPELLEWIESIGEKLICLFRRQNLESPTKQFEIRQQFQLKISKLPVYVDFDLNTQQEELEGFERGNTKLITSYHNYERTPSREDLDRLYERMDKFQPTVVKFAAFCEKERDALMLLEFLLDIRDRGPEVIVLGMGKFGLPVRIFGAEWGNYISFAPQDIAASSAPGQLTVTELNSIQAILKKRS